MIEARQLVVTGCSVLLSVPLSPAAMRAQLPRNVESIPVSGGAARESQRWMETPAAQNALARRVLATGAPGSYQVISLMLPAALPRTGNGSLEIVPYGAFRILGARSWPLSKLAGKTNLTITIGIPARALAGRVSAAEARFSVPGEPTVVLAIEIAVAAVHGLTIKGTPEPLTARPGEEVTLSYELVNSGNVQETVRIAVLPPAGWKPRTSIAPHSILQHGEIARQRMSLYIPENENTGSFSVTVEMSGSAAFKATLPIAVEVLPSLASGPQHGPHVVMGVTRSLSRNGRGSSIASIRVRGPFFDSVQMEARASIGQPRNGADRQVLARTGAYPFLPSLRLYSKTGQLVVGEVGNSFSELTGLYAYGRGALLEIRRGALSLLGFAANAERSRNAGKRRPLVGVRADVQVGSVHLQSAASHLSDGDGYRRKLDAFGIGATAMMPFGSTLSGEIAQRWYTGGAGTGFAAELKKSDSGHDFTFRVAHAPGGSDAFARAREEVIANFSQHLGDRVSLTGAAWRTADATAAFRGLHASGFSVRPEYRLHHSTRLAVDISSGDFNAESRPQFGGGAFGGRESTIGMSVSASTGRFFFNGGGSAGSINRTITPVGSFGTTQHSPKVAWTTLAGWTGVNQSMEVQARVEQTRDGGGSVIQQNVYVVSGNRLVPGPWRANFEWRGERLSGPANLATTRVHGGLKLPLPNNFTLSAYAERNNQFRSPLSSGPWSVAIRFERSTQLPMLRAPAVGGKVYRDLNGNHRRDAGEPGVRGVIVRRAAETTLTDAGGNYRLRGPGRGRPAVDEASLPVGWIPTASRSGDIGVAVTSSVDLRLVVAPSLSVGNKAIDLTPASVIALDTAGREWLARPDGAGLFKLEALPPGTYTLKLDLSELTEPLTTHDPLPILRTLSGEVFELTITLYHRAIKLWKASPGTGMQPVSQPLPVKNKPHPFSETPG